MQVNSNMRIPLAFFSILFVLVLGLSTIAYAASTHIIVMPSGASDPDAPYFWSEKTTGVTTGEITVFPNDSITWENADTAFHTITSITQSGEPNGLFDSGFINAGDSYTREFSTIGDFYYYCSIHPWMNGVVHVVKNPGSVKSLSNVASGLSEDGLGFTVKYILDVTLQKPVIINSSEKTLTFLIYGDTENEKITLILPFKLIENPNTVWVDGVMTDFETDITSTGTKLVIPIIPHSKEIKIMGSHVIPEFGFIAIGVLSIALLSSVFFTRSRLLRI